MFPAGCAADGAAGRGSGGGGKWTFADPGVRPWRSGGGSVLRDRAAALWVAYEAQRRGAAANVVPGALGKVIQSTHMDSRRGLRPRLKVCTTPHAFATRAVH